MLLKTTSCVPLALVAALLSACGPQARDDGDWMLGTFSDPGPGLRSAGPIGLRHYEFHDDGTLSVIGVTECGDNNEELRFEAEWVQQGQDEIVVELPEEDAIDAWLITPAPECGSVQVEWLQEGAVENTTSWTRGIVCTRELPACAEGTSCESCETVWCDEPPPPCDDQSQ
jgi:hypothetical protein